MCPSRHRHPLEQINIWKSKYEALAKLYSQLRQEHLDLLGKFKSIQLKANSAQEAIDKMEKMQKEIKDKNLQMADMVRERDRAKNELLRWQNTQNDEIARLKRDLEMANGRVEDLGRSKSSEVGAMVAKFNREKQDLEDLANVSSTRLNMTQLDRDNKHVNLRLLTTNSVANARLTRLSARLKISVLRLNVCRLKTRKRRLSWRVVLMRPSWSLLP